MKIVVLGLGNPILGDDSVGLRVVALVRERLAAGAPHADREASLPASVEVDEEYRGGGLRLMERLAGADRAILVDALICGTYPPGTVLCLGPEDLPTQRTASAHDASLATALRLGRAMGLAMPSDVRIVAVVAEDVLEFGEECSPAVTAAVPRAVERVLAELNRTRRFEDGVT